MKNQWHQVCRKGLFLLVCPFIVCLMSAATLQEDAFSLVDTENGPMLVRQPGLPYAPSESMIDDPAVVWSCYLVDAIYNSASNTVDGYVFAGTYLNPPMEAQLFASDGGGTPVWGYGGTKFYTDAGDNGFTLAALDDDGTGVNIIKWTGPGDGTPDWVTSFPGYAVTLYGPFVVSDDGSTIAGIAAPAGADAHLLLFDADSSTPLIDYTATGCGFPRYVKINQDGRYTAFIALATLIVFDRDSLCVRDQINMGASNSALDISGDGSLIAYGWPYLVLMEWTGSSYENLWTYNPGNDYYLNRIAISNDGSTMVSCWYNTLTHNTIKVAVHDTGSSTPLWVYDYPTSSGAWGEGTQDIEITDDGKYFIVGSLGDSASTNPEVHIFQRDATPHIYYTVDMPGSVVSVDIANDGSYATACGKHIHLGVMGRGGDIVLINTDIGTGVEENDNTVTSGSMDISINPNPFSALTKISVTTGQSTEPVYMKIYDAAGRLVKSFHPTPYAPRSTLNWRGTDDAGRKLASGVYFLHVETAEHTLTKEIIMLR
jgi:hypothetical protein